MENGSVAIKEISPSKTNPRKHFDQLALDDLAASIKKHGVLQPILLRENPGKGTKYELVAGERRWRAAKAAGLAAIPATVRKMTDQDALEIQVIENLQRSDLHPLEEGEGYKLLIEKHDYQVKDLAAKVGKSDSYIFHRLKLCNLSPEVKKAFLKDEIKPAWAEMLGRLDYHKDQNELLMQVLDNEFRDLAELKKEIEDTFLLELKKAPWSLQSADLVPAAGACSVCPKRTSAQGDMFGAAKKDFCLDGNCWKSKVAAHSKNLQKTYQAEGKKVLVGAEAEKMLEKTGGWHAPVFKVDSKPDDLNLRQPLREVLKGKDPATFLAIGTDGRPHELIMRGEAEKLLPQSASNQNGIGYGSGKVGKLSAAEKAARKTAQKIGKQRRALLPILVQALKDKAPAKLEGKVLAAVAAALIKNADYAQERDCMKLADPAGRSGDYRPFFGKLAKDPKTVTLSILLNCVEFGVSEYTNTSIHFSDGIKLLAPALGIDLEKLKKQATEAVEAAKRAPKAKAPAAKRGKKVDDEGSEDMDQAHDDDQDD